MEQSNPHNIYGPERHGRRERCPDDGDESYLDPHLGQGPFNEQNLEGLIGDGIVEAHLAGHDIDDATARAIARTIALALSYETPALDEYVKTGVVDRLAIEEEYLDLYANPATPPIVREWIDWLAASLFYGQYPTAVRPLAFPPEATSLDSVLIEEKVTIDETSMTLHRRAGMGAAARDEWIESLRGPLILHGGALRAYLSLPQVDASDPEVVKQFQEHYRGTYEDIVDVIVSVTDYWDWMADLNEWAEQRGLQNMVDLDREQIETMVRESWDIIELEEGCHVFRK